MDTTDSHTDNKRLQASKMKTHHQLVGIRPRHTHQLSKVEEGLRLNNTKKNEGYSLGKLDRMP